MIKSKSKKLILGILLCICAALFACGIFAFYNYKNNKNAVTAEAATAVTPIIYWRLENKTLTVSSNSLSGGTTGSFASSTSFSYTSQWLQYKNDIEKVTFETQVSPNTIRYWFAGCANLKDIENIYNLNTDSVTEMTGTFSGCSSLKNLDLSGFATSKVTGMSEMFCSCESLTTLDVSGFDTSNVTTMTSMFDNCIALKTLGLPNFNMSKVKTTQAMFYGCSSLETLNIDFNLSTKTTTDMRNMFNSCAALKSVAMSDSVVQAIGAANDPTYFFTNIDTWYDANGNEYTKTSPMTVGGTYYSECAHDWDDWVTTKDATCTTDGVKTHTCKKNSDHKETQTITATGHNYGAWVEKTSATCIADKVEEKTCSNCGDKQQQTLTGTKLGHLYGAPIWDWSANHSSATAKFTCTRSGCTNTRNLSATVTQSTQNATCLAAGKTTYTATLAVNGAEFQQSTYTDTQEVPITQLNHIAGTTWSKDATNHWHVCTLNCGTKLDEVAHTFDIWKVDTPATVTSTGMGHYECACGQRGADEVIPKETCAHTNKTPHAAQAATCVAAGNPEYWTCNDCGKNLDSTNSEIATIVIPIDPNNHAWGDWETETAATCVATGTEKRVCADCNHEETRDVAIDPNEHDIEHHEAQEATCTETGWNEYDTCKRDGCNYTTYSEIAALGHDWATEWSNDETNHWHICSRCDEKKDEAAHTYDWVITKDPTVDETGLKENLCTVCGNKDGEEELAKLVVDDNGSVGDLPAGNVYDLEIAVKESDSLYNIPGITKGYKVELFVIDGEDRTEYDNSKTVTLMLVIPEGMEDEFTLYCRYGEILERVDPATYTVNGKSVTIRTTLPNEYVFNAPAPEEPSSGIPWWVWLIVGIGVVVVIILIIVIALVAKNKKNNNGGTSVDNGEVLQRLDNQDQVLNELLNRGDDGGFNTPVELDENGNVIFK